MDAAVGGKENGKKKILTFTNTCGWYFIQLMCLTNFMEFIIFFQYRKKKKDKQLYRCVFW